MKLAVVTATTNLARMEPCWSSWRTHAALAWKLVIVANGPAALESWEQVEDRDRFREHDVIHSHPDYLGTVPAFAQGCELALRDPDVAVIACLHDDLEILEDGWDRQVLTHFREHERCVLVGFGGALRVGEPGMYDREFDPMTLARHEFGSNLVDAEAHGQRWYGPSRVAVLDGFSLIFRRQPLVPGLLTEPERSLFGKLARLGVIHHAYDVAMGAYMKRYGWDTWYLPVRCRHFGGQTAVGDPGYQAWARTQDPEGDNGLWKRAHRIVYEEFRDTLPFSVED